MLSIAKEICSRRQTLPCGPFSNVLPRINTTADPALLSAKPAPVSTLPRLNTTADPAVLFVAPIQVIPLPARQPVLNKRRSIPMPAIPMETLELPCAIGATTLGKRHNATSWPSSITENDNAGNKKQKKMDTSDVIVIDD
jgi:hypothetical protein